MKARNKKRNIPLFKEVQNENQQIQNKKNKGKKYRKTEMLKLQKTKKQTR
jgi:hypothetical protein